jgi:hypothetical protein
VASTADALPHRGYAARPELWGRDVQNKEPPVSLKTFLISAGVAEGGCRSVHENGGVSFVVKWRSSRIDRTTQPGTRRHRASDGHAEKFRRRIDTNQTVMALGKNAFSPSLFRFQVRSGRFGNEPLLGGHDPSIATS